MDDLWMCIVERCDSYSLLSLTLSCKNMKNGIYTYLKKFLSESCPEYNIDSDSTTSIYIYLRELVLKYGKPLFHIDDSLTGIHKDVFRCFSLMNNSDKQTLISNYITEKKNNLVNLCLSTWIKDCNTNDLLFLSVENKNKEARDTILGFNHALSVDTYFLLIADGLDHQFLTKNTDTLNNMVVHSVNHIKMFYQIDPSLLDYKQKYLIAIAACLHGDPVELENSLNLVKTNHHLLTCISAICTSQNISAQRRNCLPLLIKHELFSFEMVTETDINGYCMYGWNDIIELLLESGMDPSIYDNILLEQVFRIGFLKDNLELLSIVLKYNIDITLYMERAKKSENRGAIVMITRKIKSQNKL